jgi:3-phenylpropionate/trans-cinnamate dioxygenase ferredoxin component
MRTPESGARVLAFPPALRAPGTRDAPFEPVAEVAGVPSGAMVRVTRGDLDILIAHTEQGLVAVDDRCPHMSAPLSLGALEGCVVDCPLHSGRFDLASGEAIQFPTTGGLDAEGNYHPPWIPAGRESRPEPTDLKAQARALTRVRRVHYYPLRVSGGTIEVAFPR